MRQLYMRQKVFSLGEKFTITDEHEQPAYYVEGSFMQIPKTFTILDKANQPVGEITKKVISFMPTFYVEIPGFQSITIQKAFTFFKTRFDIRAENISINGDFLDKYFEVQAKGDVVAYVEEKWLTWGDTYKMEIIDPRFEALVVALVVAVDFAKQES
ncbi:uncharacterized protein YxjI [Streptohalobacillus salinus]|uniref:Uncharacterized protein YxjI n=1 Tax=Streptohalobacillus salinus TaxID=621096 RepID=A0A2V3VZ59_9BACI|nr:LURP-one-related family protein [Streptohalobacillus salinus]PXW87333.1 uncharacterized protein YxjI [Streptohalobacillus salinus]